MFCYAFFSFGFLIDVFLVLQGESSLKKELLMQQESDGGASRDSTSDAGSDADLRKFRDQRAFSSLNTFPFDMDVSPGPSVPLDIDTGDFFGSLNLSSEFASTEVATEWPYLPSLLFRLPLASSLENGSNSILWRRDGMCFWRDMLNIGREMKARECWRRATGRKLKDKHSFNFSRRSMGILYYCCLFYFFLSKSLAALKYPKQLYSINFLPLSRKTTRFGAL